MTTLRKSIYILTSIATLAAFCVTSFAQPPAGAGGGRQGRGQGRRGARVSAAQLDIDTLDSALKLSADQKAKIKAIQDKYRTDTQALRPQPGTQPDPANFQKMREAGQQANSDIEAVLNADQKEKLKTVIADLQALAGAGIPPALAAKLNLTADQKAKVSAIAKERQEKMAGLSQEDRRTKGREIAQEARTKIEAILTAEQKATVEKYRQENPQGQGRRQNPNP